MRPPVRGFGPQQPRGAADPSATRPAFTNNSGSEPNSPAGQVERYDCVYVRKGTHSLFLAFEPLAGWRHVAVTEGRQRGDWARFVAALLEGRHAEAERLVPGVGRAPPPPPR